MATVVTGLTRHRDHWQRQGGDCHLIPQSGPARPGHPCNETPGLVVAERQRFHASWPEGGCTIEAGDILLIPAHRPYHLDFDPRHRRLPAVCIFPCDDDLVIICRNQPEERWSEMSWRFGGPAGRLFHQTLDLIIALEAAAIDGLGAPHRPLLVLALDLALAATRQQPRAMRGGPAVAVRCRELLRQHLADPDLDIDIVATALGYHPRWLGRQYHHETGENIRTTLNNLRIQRARELLRDRTLAIAEIARRCGFTSHSHFSRTFHRIEGHTPRRYRCYGHLEMDDDQPPDND